MDSPDNLNILEFDTEALGVAESGISSLGLYRTFSIVYDRASIFVVGYKDSAQLRL